MGSGMGSGMWSLAMLDDGWARPGPSRQGVRRDVLLAGALLVAGVAGVELMRSTPAGEAMNQRVLDSYLWTVAITLPLALRRVYPLAVMVTCSVVFYVLGSRVPVASGTVSVQAALFMSIYAAWAWSRHRTRLLVASGLVVLGMFVWLAQLIAEAPTRPPTAHGVVPPGVAVAVVTVAINVVYFFGAIAWGLAAHRAAHRRQQLVEQSEALRREQRRNEQRAVAEDRLRIARDLHDAVAHHVTGIGVQAAAARHVLDRDPGGSRTALAAIEDSSRSAVREMHQIVGLLRGDGSESARAPGIRDLRSLADDARAEGVAVHHREVGDPFEVPDLIGTSVFRTAQEALTNVRRHSSAREAELVLRYLDGDPLSVEVEVVDAGPAHPRRDGTRGGFGLQGLQERAEVHDALVDIGPRPEGGFRVRVRFPVHDRTRQPVLTPEER
jgi:signal transduction histidine kinase